MAPLVRIIRHAQGLHNSLRPDGYDTRDPSLTGLGITQCARLQPDNRAFFRGGTVQIYASPSKRAIQTALLCCPPEAIAAAKQVLLIPALRETDPGFPCNRISSSEELKKEFGSFIDTAIMDYTGPWGMVRDAAEANPTSLKERAILVRQEIAHRIHRASNENFSGADTRTIVVSHGNFIKYLTEDFDSKQFKTCEARTYEFVDPVSENYTLRETDDSRAKRNGK